MDTLLRILIAAAVIYVGLCALLYFLQERMIFFPREVARPPAGGHLKPISLRRDDVVLRGYLVNADAGGPLLVYFGGNAEEASELVDTFRKLDATTVLMNYRGYGDSGGRPDAAAIIEDAQAVVAMARTTFSEPGRRLVLFGRSLGSGIAALAARDAGVDAVILLSPYRSIGHIASRRYPFVPVRWLLRQNIDATQAIAALKDKQHLLLVYAERDRVVPTAESQALAEQLPNAVVAVYQGAHGVGIELPAIWTPVRGFIDGLSG